MSRFIRSLLLLALCAAAPTAAAQRYTGTLAAGDARLASGEYYDVYTVEAGAGERVALRLASSAFDPYLIVRPPTGDALENDDCTQGDTATSCLDFTAARAGTYRVLVTSYAPGETGAYALEVAVGGARPAVDERVFAGRLAAGDATLASGEFVQTHALTVRAGQRVRATLAAEGFDGYLIAQAPSRSQEENDDCTQGDTATSCLDFTATESGTWRFLVTSFAAGETGAYTLRVALDDDGAAAGVRYERGRLEPGDATLSSGEFRDAYEFTGTGGPVVVDLRSSDFDPYLIVVLPDGTQAENDDFEGALDRAMLVVQTERGRRYRALVTSYAPGESGDYDLVIREGSRETPLAEGVRTERGRLGEGDERLRSGEFVRAYAFEGVPGQRIRLDLTSDAFDTYLLVQPPRGAVVENDDGGGRPGHSVIEMDLTEPGTYQVLVTSYAPGETGDYVLRMDFSERFGVPSAPPSEPSATPTTVPPPTPAATPVFWQPVARRIADWTLAETLEGTLARTDPRLSSGEHYHTHVFDGEAGEPIRIHLQSRAFDTYLVVTTPSGERLSNDDHEGSTDDSVLEFIMPETGRYRVTVTTYRAGETGPYTLRLSQTDAMRPAPPQFDRIVGLFAGVSDYNGRSTNLRYTADDAHLVYGALREAGMAPEDGIVLTDAQATVAGFRQALRTLAARADERTMFVLFFSGHGGQYPRTTFQREDPDMLDESLELYDGYILDDELDALLAELPMRHQLIAIDACFSGGFAKDVISRPGRMGLFSSEEDVVSQVAVKFEAGGYLSRFFADAVGGRQADEDGNGAITALELSQYIYERFRGDVAHSGREAIVARETRPGHQKLVVDRGSVGLYDTLFLLPD